MISHGVNQVIRNGAQLLRLCLFFIGTWRELSFRKKCWRRTSYEESQPNRRAEYADCCFFVGRNSPAIRREPEQTRDGALIGDPERELLAMDKAKERTPAVWVDAPSKGTRGCTQHTARTRLVSGVLTEGITLPTTNRPEKKSLTRGASRDGPHHWRRAAGRLLVQRGIRTVADRHCVGYGEAKERIRIMY
ncbi:hypothetical protein BV22DRAFT_1052378 [Leucogyrophana mollusca]|uniref:Uncharacterized protein n=1 Tax=Leucogyrophana mollusca TaxID=85980 RepID=A0ACB8AYL1_9AGAM|nr:hypothetical protein BV22DRAFT_1052378 [Leucogyrophana mollusca]